MMRLTKRRMYIGTLAVMLVMAMWSAFGNYTPEPERTKTILLWTKFFRKANYVKTPLKNCQQQCHFTSNRNELEHSDAVLFHLMDTDNKDLPKFRSTNQRWVMLHHESPKNTPGFLRQLDGLINWTITYRLDSDIVLTPIAKRRHNNLRPSSTSRNYLRDKTNGAFWFVSHCKTASNREGYIEELSKSIEVAIVGQCGNHSCVPRMSSKCYEQYAKRYKYYLSFENALCKDYITEKFYHLVDYDVIPIVFTDTDMTKIAPNHSYINALDFKSPKELGKFLNKLSLDESRYNSYFDWKEEFEIDSAPVPYQCLLCEKLHKNEPSKVWEHLYHWFIGSVHCRRWPNSFRQPHQI